MKQLLFLFLFPCLALAQYTGNGNQKITLGEQSTADGLVFRGLAADTTRKPSVDTMAYILLDTNTNIIWQYKKATNNAWTRVGGSISSGITGTLPVANGGTGQSTLAANKVMVGNGTSGVLTPTNLHWDNTNSRLGVGTSAPASILDVVGNIPAGGGGGGLRFVPTVANDGTTQYGITIAGAGTGASQFIAIGVRNGAAATKTSAMWVEATQPGLNIGYDYADVAPNNGAIINGKVGIGTASPAVQFHTTSNVRFAGLASITDLRTDADGDLFNGSDFNLKNSIDTINFGLSDVLKLKPVSFNWNDEARNINEYKSMGFIAQDVMDVIPNAASTMGDGDMQVDYNAIVATLTKAIQEQQALIKALEQRILILENK